MRKFIYLFTAFILLEFTVGCNHSRRCGTIYQSTFTTLDSSFRWLDSTLYIKTIFIDSLSIGNVFIFKSTKDGKFVQSQSVSFPAQRLMFDLREYSDFNNDGLKDLLLTFGSGARGGNTLNYLLLRDRYADTFFFVKGSEYAPNLYLDSATGFIESAVLHGGVTFRDYKIICDSLVEHGGVDVTGDGKWVIRIYYKMDDSGVKQEFYRDSIYADYDNFYVRPIRR